MLLYIKWNSIQLFPTVASELCCKGRCWIVEICDRTILLVIFTPVYLLFLDFHYFDFLLLEFYCRDKKSFSCGMNFSQLTGELFLRQPFYSFDRIFILSTRIFYLFQQFQLAWPSLKSHQILTYWPRVLLHSLLCVYDNQR